MARPFKPHPVSAEDRCRAARRALGSPARQDRPAEFSHSQVRSRERQPVSLGDSCRRATASRGSPRAFPGCEQTSRHPLTPPVRCTAEAVLSRSRGDRGGGCGAGPVWGAVGPTPQPRRTLSAFPVCSHVSGVGFSSPCLSPGRLGRHGPRLCFLLTSDTAKEPSGSSERWALRLPGGRGTLCPRNPCQSR